MKKVLKFNWFLWYKSEHQKVSCFKAKHKKRKKLCNIIQVLKQKVKNEKFASKRRDFHEKLYFFEKS